MQMVTMLLPHLLYQNALGLRCYMALLAHLLLPNYSS